MFPPGVTILNEAAWQDIPQEFGAEGETLEAASHGLRVNTSAYVRSYLPLTEPLPRDIFAARDSALRAAKQCLDAVFLYRARAPWPTGACGVEAHEEGGIYRRVLHSTSSSRAKHNIQLGFLRPVPAEWADALHWFRTGTAAHRHEAGIVNLWTAAEILAESGPRLEGHALDRVLKSVGTMSSLFLFREEQLYLAQAARAYAERYNQGAVLHPPAHAEDEDLLRWWIELSTNNTMDQLADHVFVLFPHLAFECERVRSWIVFGPEMYNTQQQTIHDSLCWIYGCRNDVVHEGRQHIPGAGIARDLITEYLGITLRRSLTMRARGSATNLLECFYLAGEMEITVCEMLEQGQLLDALLYIR